jgi:hypothetical protein
MVSAGGLSAGVESGSFIPTTIPNGSNLFINNHQVFGSLDGAPYLRAYDAATETTHLIQFDGTPEQTWHEPAAVWNSKLPPQLR